VRDRDFYKMVHAGGLHNQIQSDWPEIRAGGAKESAQELRNLLERYQDATGVEPIWD
jgi:hypothetical protein